MDLLNLAPEIQEELLFLPRTIEGRDPVTERQLRGIVAEVDWSRQMEVWEARSRSSTPRTPGRSRNAHHALR